MTKHLLWRQHGDEIVRRYQAGESCAMLATEYRASGESIRRWLHDQGVTIRVRGGTRRPRRV